jgi:hypothetical protein
MAYVRNADLTLGDMQRLIQRCGYEDITSSHPGSASVVRIGGEEIIGFQSLAAARRLLTWDLRQMRAERVARGQEG